jgi:hypothetical protein
MEQHSDYLPGLSPVEGKPVRAAFDGGMLSSDAGVLLLREVERKLGIADRLAACLADRRDPARIDHTIAEMMRFRMLAIAAGSWRRERRVRPPQRKDHDHENG